MTRARATIPVPAMTTVNLAELKDPTENMIKAGYYMKRWREEFGTNYSPIDNPHYAKNAIAYTEAALADLVAGSNAYVNEGGKILTRLYGAADYELQLSHGRVEFPQYLTGKYRWQVGEAHEMAAHTIIAHGHRPPSQNELDELGGGGGR